MTDGTGQNRTSLGIEVSSTVLNAVLVEGGVIAHTFRREPDRGADTVNEIADFVRAVRSEVGRVDSLGIAIPGLIHGDSRRVAFSAANPQHSDVDIAAGMLEKAGLRTTVENDANAAAYGEFRLGAGRESKDLFYATLGDGVGGAFILNGSIWRGTAGFAGEFGYVAINSEGMRLEDVASSANIVRRTRNRMRQDRTSSLSSLSEASIGISDILGAAEVEDDLAQMMLERTGEYVGTAVASVINLLNIETIVLGGDLMTVGHFVLDAVISRARELSFGPSFTSTRIVAGSLGRNAAAVGVALLAGEDPSTV